MKNLCKYTLNYISLTQPGSNSALNENNPNLSCEPRYILASFLSAVIKYL